MQQYVMKFISDLWQGGGFSPSTPVSSTNNTDPHDINWIVLIVALNTIIPTLIMQISTICFIFYLICKRLLI
jgi:hypothetical protein